MFPNGNADPCDQVNNESRLGKITLDEIIVWCFCLTGVEFDCCILVQSVGRTKVLANGSPCSV